MPNAPLKPITTSVYTFSNMIEGGFVYVDKTARGRIDAVVEMPDYVYVFEFKLRGTSEEALAQIEERGYAAKFASDPRKVFKVGCAFDWDARNLGRWIVDDVRNSR